ncbi:MAG: chain length determinant protein tyrosine kinase EpsG [Steroidobacteraceae bacterium]
MNAATKSATAESLRRGHEQVPIGELLVTTGKISELDVARVIALQKQKKLRFGEAAQELGLLRAEDVERALAQQFDYPYVAERGSTFSPLLVTACEPFGTRAEAVRGLRSQLALRWFDDRRKILAVAAPRGGGGSSVVAANLAIAFAQLGERVLLIDANLRRPVQHTLFGIGAVEGLSGLLAARGAFRDSLRVVEPFATLAVLCAGAIPPNPHELLSSVGFAYLVETAPAAFDIVIVDSPPLLEYSDGQLIAARAGGCLLVARRHQTSLTDIEDAKTQLEPTGAAVVGAVLND